jgi:hypothetical protein
MRSAGKVRNVFTSFPPRWHPYRVGQTLPKGPLLYRLHVGRHCYHMHWLPYRGLTMTAWADWPQHGTPLHSAHVLPRVVSMKRLEKLASTGLVQPGADPTTTMLARLKALIEWCCKTEYDDGSPRRPGTFRLASRGTVWSATVTDPDSRKRLPVIGVQLDAVLAAVLAHLVSDQAPWEVDPYAPEESTKKGKK